LKCPSAREKRHQIALGYLRIGGYRSPHVSKTRPIAPTTSARPRRPRQTSAAAIAHNTAPTETPKDRSALLSGHSRLITRTFYRFADKPAGSADGLQGSARTCQTVQILRIAECSVNYPV